MDDTDDLEGDYKVIEQCLRQTQTDLNKVLSSLTDLSKCGNHDNNNENNLNETFSTSRTTSVGTFPRRRPSRSSRNVDFLAIFAQHDLVADRRSLELFRRAAPGSETWNYTLPNLRKRPARSTMLAPSEFASKSSFSRRRNTDWGEHMNGNMDCVLPCRDINDVVVEDKTMQSENRTGQRGNLPDHCNGSKVGVQRRVTTTKGSYSSSVSPTSEYVDFVHAGRTTNDTAVKNRSSISLQNGALLDSETVTDAIQERTSSLNLPNGRATGAATNERTDGKRVHAHKSKSLSSTSSSELSSPMSDTGKPVLCIPPPPPLNCTNVERNLENVRHHDDNARKMPPGVCKDGGRPHASQDSAERNDRTGASKSVLITEDPAKARLRYVQAALSRGRPRKPKNNATADTIPRMQEVNKKHNHDRRRNTRTSSVKSRNNSSVLLRQRSRSVSPENWGPRRGSSLRKRNSSPAKGEYQRWKDDVGFADFDIDIIGKELRETEALIEKTNTIADRMDYCDDDRGSVTLPQSTRTHRHGTADKRVVSSNIPLRFADVQTVSCEEVHYMPVTQESDNNTEPLLKDILGTSPDAGARKSAILVITSEMPQSDDASWTDCTEIVATRNIEAMQIVVAIESVVAVEMTVAVQCDMHGEKGCVDAGEPDDDLDVTHRPTTPREQRRGTRSVRPMMPVIVEDMTRTCNPDDDAPGSSSAASSLRKRVSISDDCSASSLERPAKNDRGIISESKSLLDTLHKKLYPGQYDARGKVKSAESLCNDADGDSPDLHHLSTRGSCHASGARSVENLIRATSPCDQRTFDQHLSPGEPMVSMLSAPLAGLCDKNAGRFMLPRSTSPQLPSTSPRQRPTSSRERSMSPQESQMSPDIRRCHRCHETRQSSTSPSNFEEIEALEARTWLRAAGFPQYAQMYEDKLFPVDISSVEKDHDFLDRDSICSLFRRLNTLNKCATMKIEAPPRKMVDDSDDEDQCALSDKWRYQRSSRRWSRKDLEPVSNGNDKMRSSSSHDSVLTDNEETTSQMGDSPVFVMKSPHIPHIVMPVDAVVAPIDATTSPWRNPSSIEDARSPATGFAVSPRLRRAASDRFRGAKNFLKRMESLSARKSTRRHKGPISRFDIGSPVLVDTPEVQERMDQLGCVDISPTLPSSSSPLAVSPSDDPFFASSPGASRKEHGSATNSLPGSQMTTPSTLRRSHSGATSRVEMYSLQPGYKPGGFPKLISNGYIEMSNGSQLNYRTGSFNLGSDRHAHYEPVVLRHSKTSSPEGEDNPFFDGVGSEHRHSIYDNVPVSSPGDAQVELDMILCDLFKNINGLNQSLQQYSADASDLNCHGVTDTSGALTMKIVEDSKDINILAMAEDLDDEDDTEISQCVDDTDDTIEMVAPHTEDEGSRSASPLSSSHDTSDGDSPESREDEGSDRPEKRERRDSGVGSSLTRAPSDRRRHRIRWHSFMKQHRPSFNSQNMLISSMSVGQMMVLHKLCLLKITALMERYSPSNRSGWNWAMPKFIKRLKAPDYKDKNVFGVPLLVILQRTGQALPQCILYAMRCLRRTAKDAVGIFRKSGVRSRIQKLRNEVEENPDGVDFESLHAYDVADLLKQYFRELPECLLTNKLSETFVSIYTHVPKEYHLEALQAVVMLLPDENRNVLQSLLLFLSDMARFSDHNQMNASNLAVCFAPSLFHMCGPRNNPNASPRRGRKQMGIPDQRELLDQKAAHECLTQMVIDCKKIFAIPDDMLGRCRFSYIEQGDPVPLEELGCKRLDNETVDHTAYIDSCIQGVLKEAHDKFKGWVTVTASPANVESAFKKVGDGHPLRLWKCATEVEAPPVEVLNRILRERHLWDEDLAKWRVVEKLDAQTDVFQYVINSMVPHPSRDFCELRSYRTQLPKGACILVSTSVEHKEAPLLGGVRAVVLASRFLIEPCGSGKSRLTHICRVDTRGHSPEWYNKCYGHLVAIDIARIRDSFKQPIATTDGPETKI